MVLHICYGQLSTGLFSHPFPTGKYGFYTSHGKILCVCTASSTTQATSKKPNSAFASEFDTSLRSVEIDHKGPGSMTCWYCWWKNSGDHHQLRLVSYPIICRVLYIPGGLLGFLPSKVFPKFSDFTPMGQQTTNQRSINQSPPNVSSFPCTEKHLTNQQGTIPRTKMIPPHRSWGLWDSELSHGYIMLY